MCRPISDTSTAEDSEVERITHLSANTNTIIKMEKQTVHDLLALTEHHLLEKGKRDHAMLSMINKNISDDASMFLLLRRIRERIDADTDGRVAQNGKTLLPIGIQTYPNTEMEMFHVLSQQSELESVFERALVPSALIFKYVDLCTITLRYLKVII